MTVEDGSGNIVTTSTVPVTIALGSNPSGADLNGAATISAIAGIATFPYESINRVGNGYTLTATATDLVGATSATFNVMDETIGTFSAVSTSHNATCGVVTSGAAYCWGDNSLGQLGNNSVTSTNTPIKVIGGLTFRSVSVGSGQYFACGLTTGGAAWCWGYNEYRPARKRIVREQHRAGPGQRQSHLHAADCGRWWAGMRARCERRRILLGMERERTTRQQYRCIQQHAAAGRRRTLLCDNQCRGTGPDLRRDDRGHRLLLGIQRARRTRQRLDGQQLPAGCGLGWADVQDHQHRICIHMRRHDQQHTLLLGRQHIRRTRQRLDDEQQGSNSGGRRECILRRGCRRCVCLRAHDHRRGVLLGLRAPGTTGQQRRHRHEYTHSCPQRSGVCVDQRGLRERMRDDGRRSGTVLGRQFVRRTRQRVSHPVFADAGPRRHSPR